MLNQFGSKFPFATTDDLKERLQVYSEMREKMLEAFQGAKDNYHNWLKTTSKQPLDIEKYRFKIKDLEFDLQYKLSSQNSPLNLEFTVEENPQGIEKIILYQSKAPIAQLLTIPKGTVLEVSIDRNIQKKYEPRGDMKIHEELNFGEKIFKYCTLVSNQEPEDAHKRRELDMYPFDDEYDIFKEILGQDLKRKITSSKSHSGIEFNEKIEYLQDGKIILARIHSHSGYQDNSLIRWSKEPRDFKIKEKVESIKFIDSAISLIQGRQLAYHEKRY